jgi:hypothetical protein
MLLVLNLILFVDVEYLCLRRVHKVVCFILGNSPASEFYMPIFRNTLSVPSSQAGEDEQTECSEKSEYKIQTPGNYPEESMQHSQHGESLKSRVHKIYLL